MSLFYKAIFMHKVLYKSSIQLLMRFSKQFLFSIVSKIILNYTKRIKRDCFFYFIVYNNIQCLK